jgi:cytoskeletal protein CcmA (bactofilin family)
MPIGETIVIKGTLSAQEDLAILGTVEGSIALEGHTLTLAGPARIRADVAAATVVVSGTVEGDIVASDRVEVRTTGSVEGRVSVPRLAVEDGGRLQGRVEMPPKAEVRRFPMPVAV